MLGVQILSVTRTVSPVLLSRRLPSGGCNVSRTPRTHTCCRNQRGSPCAGFGRFGYYAAHNGRTASTTCLCRALGISPRGVHRRASSILSCTRTRMYNPMGFVHGGYISTLLDTCMACAVHTRLKAGNTYTTLELSLKFVRSITPRITGRKLPFLTLLCLSTENINA